MDLSAKLHLLKQIPYFAALPRGEVRELAARLRERHYRAGDVIFRKGNRCEGLVYCPERACPNRDHVVGGS